MKYTIYLDVLLCINLITDYLLLLSVDRYRHLHTKPLRLFFGSLAGAAGALVILLPPMPWWLSWTVSVVEALVMTAAAFLPMRLSAYCKASVCLFVTSFCYCGVMTAILGIFSPKALVVRNSTVYIGISPLLLVILTLISYFVLKAAAMLTERRKAPAANCQIKICHNGKTLALQGMVDTGNTLHEPFSGECVIVGKERLFREMLDVRKCMNSDSKEMIGSNIRLVPYRSVGGSGVIPAFKPSKIYLDQTEVSAYLALCREEYLTDECELLVPAELLRKGS